MTGRVFDHVFAWQMTPRQVADAASLLATAAAGRFGLVDQVIAIERGGIEPATCTRRRPGRSHAPSPASQRGP